MPLFLQSSSISGDLYRTIGSLLPYQKKAYYLLSKQAVLENYYIHDRSKQVRQSLEGLKS